MAMPAVLKSHQITELSEDEMGMAPTSAVDGMFFGRFSVKKTLGGPEKLFLFEHIGFMLVSRFHFRTFALAVGYICFITYP